MHSRSVRSIARTDPEATGHTEPNFRIVTKVQSERPRITFFTSRGGRKDPSTSRGYTIGHRAPIFEETGK